MSYQVLLFYKYVTISDPEALAQRVRELIATHGLKGRCIIAEEGINATFEGETEATESFVAEFLQDARFKDMKVKRSEGDGKAFGKAYVKVRDEIVGTHFDKKIDPRVRTAPAITPEELKNWYQEEKDFVVIDMRNDYEFQSGHFKGSVNPGLGNSRDLPDALPALEQYKDKKVLTVCTGGIRCEKMSAFLLENGFSDVSQLENGMHGYMEKYPGEDFLGTLYTFDNRLTMDFGGEREIVGRCKLCNEKTETYVNCGDDFCHLHFLVCDACQKPEGAFCSPACEEAVKARGYSHA
ncbi:MAG: UPF0176 protein [Parcubacteria bacterium C7867-004]|nr:MAG: UPF0176 protein [Parcubacteria bacterium C7867-004]